MHARLNRGLAAGITAGAAVLAILGAAGAASAAPATAAGPHFRHHHRFCSVRVVSKTSGAFSNNEDILQGWIVPGSVSVVATQGQTPGQDNPPVDTFGPNTGYTVSSDWHTVTLQPPYAGSNDGFTTYYSVFVIHRPWWARHLHCHVGLQTFTSGAFSNNQNILTARNIVPGSVFVVATQGQSPGYDNPSVNGFMENNGYTVAYSFTGATVTLDPPYAGSNDGFTSYYTVLRHAFWW